MKSDEPSTSSDWHPTSALLTGEALEEALKSDKSFAVHFWAGWNGVDKEMDEIIQRIRPRLGDWIEFFSSNVDDPLIAEHCKRFGVANIPCVLVFANGKKVRHIIGLKDEKQLAVEILRGLTKETNESRPWWKLWYSRN